MKNQYRCSLATIFIVFAISATANPKPNITLTSCVSAYEWADWISNPPIDVCMEFPLTGIIATQQNIPVDVSHVIIDGNTITVNPVSGEFTNVFLPQISNSHIVEVYLLSNPTQLACSFQMDGINCLELSITQNGSYLQPFQSGIPVDFNFDINQALHDPSCLVVDWNLNQTYLGALLGQPVQKTFFHSILTAQSFMEFHISANITGCDCPSHYFCEDVSIGPQDIVSGAGFDISIFPNPSNGGIITVGFDWEDFAISELMIISLTSGEVVIATSVPEEVESPFSMELELNDVDNGLFEVIAINGNGETASTTLIIEE